MSHTPGPWIMNRRPNHRETGSAHYTVEALEFDAPCPCGATHPKGRLIAWLAGGLGDSTLRPEAWRHDPPTEADARLIAAAPEMLAALRRAKWHLDENCYTSQTEHSVPIYEEIEAAITKAEGR